MMVLEVEVDQALGLLPQIDQDKFLLEEHRKQYFTSYLAGTSRKNLYSAYIALSENFWNQKWRRI